MFCRRHNLSYDIIFDEGKIIKEILFILQRHLFTFIYDQSCMQHRLTDFQLLGEGQHLKHEAQGFLRTRVGKHGYTG